MESFLELIYTGDPVESVIRLLLVLSFLEVFAAICSYLGGIK